MPIRPVRLQPKQREFYELFKATGHNVATQIGFGGARGGAKSGTIRRVALGCALDDPGTHSAIIRRVYDDVKVNHIDPFFVDYPDLRPYYRVVDHELLLPEQLGSGRISFNYAESAAEVNRKFWGPEWKRIYVDQAEQFSGEELRVIKTANRWPGSKPGECKLGMFFNPGGVGTEFLRRIFYLKQYQDQERSTDYAFIQAYGWDNYEWFRGQVGISEYEFYKLDSETRFRMFIESTQYGRELNSLPESLRAGHLLGSFDSFAGQYFAGVWDESKVVLNMAQTAELVHPWWTRWMATDWGFAHYAVTLWAASGKVSPQEIRRVLGVEVQDSVNVTVVYREMVTHDTAEADLADMMIEQTPQREIELLQAHYLSPDAWSKRGAANTVAEQLTEKLTARGLPAPRPADNQRVTEGDRIGGWRLLWNALNETCKLRSGMGYAVGDVLMVSAACPQVISSMPLLIRDPKRLEDVQKIPGALADDVGDCIRYLYKSYLDPLEKAPLAVRRRQVYDSYDRAVRTDESVTALGMAMRKFDAEEKQSNRRTRRRR